ncbi:cytoplasmic 60S subunit biogenesis factor ZNF622-like [Saccoglossus kowalevskii]|uniref:Zinc finger protein 622-like n=1 Tax=Saccoglossus kowalevskii TaxID=10224 RepID=A0ABM0M231_SACKO|nr:PREDICTED: zinc finger protein 622-like [Saccoglossus kowalevskii]
MSSPFTCITCRVAFISAEIQRAHYKSDWHRYNLKRKVAEMPPVTADNFQQRVLAQRAESEEVDKNTTSQCKICNKHFNSQNAYDNHMKSKKHKETEAKITKKIHDEMVKKRQKNAEKGIENNDEDDDVALKNAVNLAIAGYRASDVKRNDDENLPKGVSGSSSGEASGAARKKAKVHLHPAKIETDEDMDYDSDESWEEVEGDAIAVTDCLFCSQPNNTIEENVQHMTKVHSFFIPSIDYVSDLEGLIGYLGEKIGEGFVCLWCNERGKAFYSAQAVQNHMKDRGHCKMLYEGAAIYEYADFYDYRISYPDYEEHKSKKLRRSDEAGASGGDEEMDTDDDDDLDDNALQVSDDGGELILPSGSRVGHRDLMRYYKQKFPATRKVAVTGTRNRDMVGRVITQYKALGWTGATGEAAQRKIKDLKVIQKWKAKQDINLRMKANKFQPHLRPQVVF